MRVIPVFLPAVHSAIDARVQSDVESSLGKVSTVRGKFVVNDSPWFAVNDRGKVMPCVVNQAQFISGSFQKQLHARGWHPEKEIDGQTIDAFLEFAVPGPLPTIGVDEGDSIDFLKDYLATPDGVKALAGGESKPEIFARLYDSFVHRSSIATRDSIDRKLHKYLKPRGTRTHFKIGLEFETGNIASSFRAILKLSHLYRQQHIDGGVFVTAIDKANCATRIWPASNRNGSFQELKNRNYRSNLSFPLWEYGFAPDSFSHTAPYLASNGKTYKPKPTGRKITAEDGHVYSVFTMWDGKEILQ
jgi:hypothetical protein